MASNLDETELARLEELANNATTRPWRGDGHKGCGYGWVKIPGFNTTGTERSARLGQYLGADDDARYIAAACNSVPALVAEIRRLLEALSKEHRAWQCAEGRGDGLEMENSALREKVEAWEWFEECFEVTQWIMVNGQATPESRFIDVLSNNARVESLISTNFARERAAHADRK